MRVATLRDGSRDGRLVVVNREGNAFVPASHIAPTLQAALDRWSVVEPALRKLANVSGAEPLDLSQLMAPLPRAYEWVDGSAYINHIVLVRKARGAEPPETLKTDPLVYQGGSGIFLGPYDDIALIDPAWGLDFESEVCVVLGDTPQGTKAADALQYIKLVMVANDVTYRNLIPEELAKGFGFFCSKPATGFAPFAITPDELGSSFRDGRVYLKLRTWLNDEVIGDTDAGPEMHFSFCDLIEHICKSRSFTAGTILGSGTVSNENIDRGISCLAERRMREIIETGSAKTPFLKAGDRVRISLIANDGTDVCGILDQQVRA